MHTSLAMPPRSRCASALQPSSCRGLCMEHSIGTKEANGAYLSSLLGHKEHEASIEAAARSSLAACRARDVIASRWSQDSLAVIYRL